jgi:DnaJ-class molecular chaperone
MPRTEEKTCPNCKGGGQAHIGKGVYVRCSTCNGSGTVSK